MDLIHIRFYGSGRDVDENMYYVGKYRVPFQVVDKSIEMVFGKYIIDEVDSNFIRFSCEAVRSSKWYIECIKNDRSSETDSISRDDFGFPLRSPKDTYMDTEMGSISTLRNELKKQEIILNRIGDVDLLDILDI